jgi:UDP-glucose 4-epimerase
MSSKSQKILVTGASGFIGGHVIARLLAQNCEVHAVSRRKYEETRNHVRWWVADLVDIDRVQEIVTTIAPDKIIHLASLVSGNRSADFVMPALRNNFLSAVHLMLAATSLRGTRVILAGSMEEPGPAGDSQVPVSPYAAAKWAASGYSKMFHALYGLDVVNVRIAMVYGPGQTDSGKLIPYVIRSLLSGETPKLGSGKRSVDWVYVEDVADGLVRACFSDMADRDTLDLGSGELIPIREVVERLATIINPSIVPCFGELPDRAHERDWFADVTATEERIAWQATTSLDNGLSKTVNWYRDNIGLDEK